jgi:hypothetical protein
MLRTSQIKQDLKEIKYYYTMKKTFDLATEEVKPEIILNRVHRYNAIMKNAPAKLYIIYYSLYVNCNTHQNLADEWGYSREYVTTLNEKLVKYLQMHLH